MEAEEVTSGNWSDLVLSSKTPVVVMFYSPTCPHCTVMKPHFDKYAQEYSGKVRFLQLNVTENIQTARDYGVMSTPTFKFFCQSRPIQELVGAAYPPLVKKLVEDMLSYGAGCADKSTRIAGYV
jgi:thioredoxin 1